MSDTDEDVVYNDEEDKDFIIEDLLGIVEFYQKLLENERQNKQCSRCQLRIQAESCADQCDGRGSPAVCDASTQTEARDTSCQHLPGGRAATRNIAGAESLLDGYSLPQANDQLKRGEQDIGGPRSMVLVTPTAHASNGCTPQESTPNEGLDTATGGGRAEDYPQCYKRDERSEFHCGPEAFRESSRTDWPPAKGTTTKGPRQYRTARRRSGGTAAKLPPTATITEASRCTGSNSTMSHPDSTSPSAPPNVHDPSQQRGAAGSRGEVFHIAFDEWSPALKEGILGGIPKFYEMFSSW